MDSEWKYPAIVSEKALKEAREKVNPTSVDGKSEFSLAWRMCLEWVQKNYDLNPKGNAGDDYCYHANFGKVPNPHLPKEQWLKENGII